MPIPCSLKELLECGPGSIMKTATISWMPSKLLPLTASLLISGCAKCLACSFSFSYCSSPLRKVQDYSHSQHSDGKVEAQRGRVTRPRLQLLNGRAGTVGFQGLLTHGIGQLKENIPAQRGTEKQLLSKKRL